MVGQGGIVRERLLICIPWKDSARPAGHFGGRFLICPLENLEQIRGGGRPCKVIGPCQYRKRIMAVACFRDRDDRVIHWLFPISYIENQAGFLSAFFPLVTAGVVNMPAGLWPLHWSPRASFPGSQRVCMVRLRYLKLTQFIVH